MSLAPLLNASPVVPVHAFAAMAASNFAVVQQAAPNGRTTTLAKSLCRDVVAWRPASERATPCTIELNAR
jgi:uncharacterized membrane protein